MSVDIAKALARGESPSVLVREEASKKPEAEQPKASKKTSVKKEG